MNETLWCSVVLLKASKDEGLSWKRKYINTLLLPVLPPPNHLHFTLFPFSFYFFCRGPWIILINFIFVKKNKIEAFKNWPTIQISLVNWMVLCSVPTYLKCLCFYWLVLNLYWNTFQLRKMVLYFNYPYCHHIHPSNSVKKKINIKNYTTCVSCLIIFNHEFLFYKKLTKHIFLKLFFTKHFCFQKMCTSADIFVWFPYKSNVAQ